MLIMSIFFKLIKSSQLRGDCISLLYQVACSMQASATAQRRHVFRKQARLHQILARKADMRNYLISLQSASECFLCSGQKVPQTASSQLAELFTRGQLCQQHLQRVFSMTVNTLLHNPQLLSLFIQTKSPPHASFFIRKALLLQELTQHLEQREELQSSFLDLFSGEGNFAAELFDWAYDFRQKGNQAVNFCSSLKAVASKVVLHLLEKYPLLLRPLLEDYPYIQLFRLASSEHLPQLYAATEQLIMDEFCSPGLFSSIQQALIEHLKQSMAPSILIPEMSLFELLLRIVSRTQSLQLAGQIAAICEKHYREPICRNILDSLPSDSLSRRMPMSLFQAFQEDMDVQKG